MAATATTNDQQRVDQRYREKRRLLLAKYRYIRLSNDQLKNRLYHVKKEIKHLKRLKRILCQRLLTHNDRFMENSLEIPDNEPGSNVADKIIADVASIAGSQSSTAPRRRSRPDHRRSKVEDSLEIRSIADAAKLSVSSIIDSVITESHEERLLARADCKSVDDMVEVSSASFVGLLSPGHSESTGGSEAADDANGSALLVEQITAESDALEVD